MKIRQYMSAEDKRQVIMEIKAYAYLPGKGRREYEIIIRPAPKRHKRERICECQRGRAG